MQINNLGAGLAVRNEPQHDHVSATTETKMRVLLIGFSYSQNKVPYANTNVGVRKLTANLHKPSLRACWALLSNLRAKLVSWQISFFSARGYAEVTASWSYAIISSAASTVWFLIVSTRVGWFGYRGF